MSKKHHNRQDVAGKQADGSKSQLPSNVTLDDHKDGEQKKKVGPPIPVVERQPIARALTEFLLVFAVFFIYGAWPVPDTNEPYYVGKAMHAWQPDILKNDTFLNSHNTHWLFYKTFGWLTLYVSLDTATWIGRSVLWLGLAFGWYRLSRVVVPIPWASVVSALVFSCFVVKFQMAGEWIIGGIEGKVFAYVFVFLGLDALARNRWNLMWVLFGMAAAYHPIVGGWAVVAGGIAWLMQRRSDHTPLKRMILPLLVGGAISLIGVMPSITMDWQNHDSQNVQDVDERSVASNPIDSATPTDDPQLATYNSQLATQEQSWYIAVFKRLSHHQLPYAFRTSWVIRLSLLTVAWLFCAAIVWGRKTIRPDDPQAVPDDEPIVQPPAPPGFRIACFIVGTIMISCVGFIIAYGLRVPIEDESQLPAKVVRAAMLLRFYWFRMTDITIPLGMALCGTAILYRTITLCRKTQYPTEAQWWVKTLGGFAFMVCVIYGLAFWYFANDCPPSGIGLSGFSYELRTLETKTLAYGVVLVFSGFLLFWNRNHTPQPDCPPARSMLQLLLSLVVVFGAAVPMLLDHTQSRLYPTIPRTVLRNSPGDYRSWREMCNWIAENTEEDAVFLVPRRDESFKWYAKRANVSTWKEMPQDAASMVKWYETMNDCYSPSLSDEEKIKFYERPALLYRILKTKSQTELIALQEKYQFTHILSESPPPQQIGLDLPVVYETEFYILYRADAQTLNPQSHLDMTPSATLPGTPSFSSMSEPVITQPFSGNQSPQLAIPQFTPEN